MINFIYFHFVERLPYGRNRHLDALILYFAGRVNWTAGDGVDSRDGMERAF